MPRPKPPPEPTQQWPPRSPHEALVSTPEGRKKFRQIIQQSPSRSPSQMSPSRRLLFGSPSRPASILSPTRPSPAARAMSALSARGTTSFANVGGDVDMFDGLDNEEDEDEDEDEDEETLRLKLEAIQAKLKLKRLMKAKKRAGGASSASGLASGTATPVPATNSTVGVFGGLGKLQDAPKITSQPGSDMLNKSRPMREAQDVAEIQVPASPSKDMRQAHNRPTPGYRRPHSPIRPPSSISSGVSRTGVESRANTSTSASTFHPQQKYLERRSHTPSAKEEPVAPKQSFAERLSAARHEEDDRREKDRRIKAARTGAFAITEKEMGEFKSHPVEIPPSIAPVEAAPSFSRNEILGGKALKTTTDQADSDDGESLEPYSGVHLTTRIIPHQTFTRSMSSKKILLLSDLLKDVRAPNFQLPDVESDIVVMAIIASKSNPKSHKNNTGAKGEQDDGGRGKYMVLTLTDLTYELDLFLFASGFDKWWKLSTGTVVAILNPVIMPPPPGKADTSRFSLVINSDADMVLEVGTARDLGYCGAMKKGNIMCSSWVNLRRTEFCEFHVNEAVKKKRAGRMEVNTMDGWSFSGGGGRGRGRGGRGGGGGEEREKYKPGGDSWNKKGPKDYDRETHTKFFISKSSSVASLLDSETANFADRKEREEHLKRRLIREEKERDIAKKLAKMGGRAGSEYMERTGSRADGGEGPAAPVAGSGLDKSGLTKATRGTATTSSSLAPPPPPQPKPRSAKALGMIPVQGSTDLKLKRKRPIDITPSSFSTTNTTTTATISSSLTSGSSTTITNTTTNATNSKITTSSKSKSNPSNNNDNNKPGAFGWGKSLKTKLTKMKDGETLQPQPQPQPQPPTQTQTQTQTQGETEGQEGPLRKKTRFLTDHGATIKDTAVTGGRQSVGVNAAAAAILAAVVDDDDSSDDDLVII